jgi:ribosome maturation factor RimP
MQHSAGKEWSLIEPVVESMGYELVGVEYQRSGETGVLRIFIDKEDGISVADCSKVSHQVGGVLDVEDPINNHYKLEVSSPGLNRPIFRESDFVKFKGHTVKIKLSIPYEGQRKFNGVLSGIEDSMVVIVMDGMEYLLPVEQIERANLVPQFTKGEKKKF